MGKNKREPVHESYEMASGPIAYNMTNDYMFRAILQKNEFVLRGLIGALLPLDPADVCSAPTGAKRRQQFKMNFCIACEGTEQVDRGIITFGPSGY